MAIILIYLFCSITSCVKVQQPCKRHYAFDFPISVTPKDTFMVGDTIWWEMNLPNEILDQEDGTYIDIANFELFFSFMISKADSTVPVTGNGQIHLFNLIERIGKITQRQNGLLYTYIQTESTQNKRFLMGCVPTISGTYSGSFRFPNLYFNKDNSPYESLTISDSTCEETLTYRSKITINNKDINYHMVEGICQYTLDGRRLCYEPASDIYMHSIYAFHVKEP